MIITKNAIHRRTLLEGLGATIGLPFLDSMIPALSPLQAQSVMKRKGPLPIPPAKTGIRYPSCVIIRSEDT